MDTRWTEDKNDAIIDDDSQKGCVNGNENMFDRYR